MKLSSIFALAHSRTKFAGVLAIASMALVLSAGSAQAACSYTGAEQVFGQWGDRHHYVLAPDGGFEAGGSGWSLTGGATTVAGNESYYLNEPGDSRSLSLPAGSKAVSPPICMSLDTPMFRMLARNTGDPSSRLRVEAVYKLLGLVRTKAVSTVVAGPTWAPTQQMSTVLSLATIIGVLIPSSIQIHITPLDSKGQWQVDDLYIDPFARR
ncbi:MAG TPA: hypothetical protein VNP96_03420 [Solirubrobacterales bacterium]|nr:hypothetical protein [Solirubrobacterales bacterium]